MVWTVGSVTLPTPEKMRVHGSTNKQTENNSGDYPTVMNDGKSLSITLEGTLVGDLSTVWTATIDPLLALIGTEVAVVGDGLIDGDYNLDDFRPSRDNPAMYTYTLSLSKAKTIVTFVRTWLG